MAHEHPPRTRSWWMVPVLLAAGAGLAAFTDSPARADDLVQVVKDLMADYAGQLEQVAAACEKHGLTEQAKKTRSWVQHDDPNTIRIAILPREVGPPELPEDTSPKVCQWHERFRQLRRQQATSLESLARRAVRSGRASLAFSLALAAIRENPDHEGIRRLLGYQRYRGGWYTLYEVNKLKTGQVWTEKFGWLPKDRVSPYQQGQRFSRGAWITAEEDAQQHSEIVAGWDIETEHYTIRTNRGLEAGVALGVKLERLHQVWKQLFVRYFLGEAEVTELFDGRARRKPAPTSSRLQVVYFRDRDGYNRALKQAFPNIEMSIGVYVENTRRAYFFAGEGYDERTLYHEATHQLFQESRPVPPGIARQGNFWIIEGIAMYMESLRDEDGFHVLGGFDDPRMKAARFRLLQDKFYVPLAEFSTFGMKQLQADKRVATLYSQAAGLTHFLIHYDGGRYRDALVACLSTVYSGRDNPQTLAQVTGVSLGELDKQYRKFVQSPNAGD